MDLLIIHFIYFQRDDDELERESRPRRRESRTGDRLLERLTLRRGGDRRGGELLSQI